MLVFYICKRFSKIVKWFEKKNVPVCKCVPPLVSFSQMNKLDQAVVFTRLFAVSILITSLLLQNKHLVHPHRQAFNAFTAHLCLIADKVCHDMSRCVMTNKCPSTVVTVGKVTGRPRGWTCTSRHTEAGASLVLSVTPTLSTKETSKVTWNHSICLPSAQSVH